MHETALIAEVLKTVRQSALENNLPKVTKIKLAIGKLSMALPEALIFAFQVLKKGTICEEAELEIESKEIILQCLDCTQEFRSQDYNFSCPFCARSRIKIIQGRELHIISFEGEENELGSNCGSTLIKSQ
ncbi:MAG TPA: hydrogenase maturation nickel metallochaperone HypA [Desulfotomaculum sp.]|nr:hydrogenase maturation nickel metallochaperone HypA [Desulfotomaculum sp.]